MFGSEKRESSTSENERKRRNEGNNEKTRTVNTTKNELSVWIYNGSFPTSIAAVRCRPQAVSPVWALEHVASDVGTRVHGIRFKCVRPKGRALA